jgi:putative acetyltransferase
MRSRPLSLVIRSISGNGEPARSTRNGTWAAGRVSGKMSARVDNGSAPIGDTREAADQRLAHVTRQISTASKGMLGLLIRALVRRLRPVTIRRASRATTASWSNAVPTVNPVDRPPRRALTLRMSSKPEQVAIRPEYPTDTDTVAGVVETAFQTEGPVVARLVEDLRRSLATEPGCSLVAVVAGELVGHVMTTRSLLDAPDRLVDVQVLSPLAVAPARQGQGIGAALIAAATVAASSLGAPLLFLEGDPSYYGRHGFVPAGTMGFRRPSLRIPPPAFQVRPLSGYDSSWMTGTLVYRQAFWDHDSVGLRTGPVAGAPT